MGWLHIPNIRVQVILRTVHTAQNNSCLPIIHVIPHAQALILTSVTGSELVNFRLINARLGH